MRRYIVLILLIFGFFKLYAQQTQTEQKNVPIELIHVNVLRTIDSFGPNMEFLTGQVILGHDSTIFYCDSAVLNREQNSFRGFNHVRSVSVKGKDTVVLKCDSIFYFGKNKLAYAYSHVELQKDSVTLYTDTLKYDIKHDSAFYLGWGKIVSKSDTLISSYGLYVVRQKKAYFWRNVKILSKKYKIYTDTLVHDLKNDISYFYGPTWIRSDSNYIFTKYGFFDHKKNIAAAKKFAQIGYKHHIIQAQEIFYNRKTGIGQAFRDVKIVDTVQHYTLTGGYAQFDRYKSQFLMTVKPTLLQVDNNDSLWLYGDTLYSYIDTLRQAQDTFVFRKVLGYRHVKVFHRHLQMKCDSIVYSFLDSTIYMYGSPVLWSDSIEMYADKAELSTIKSEPYQLILDGKAYIIEHTLENTFNQIYGDKIIINFKYRHIYRVDVYKDAKAIYFIYSDSVLIGINDLQCDTIQIFMKNRRVNSIKAYGNPSGKLVPPSMATKKDKFLDGFQWLDQYRPKRPSDIYIWKRD